VVRTNKQCTIVVSPGTIQADIALSVAGRACSLVADAGSMLQLPELVRGMITLLAAKPYVDEELNEAIATAASASAGEMAAYIAAMGETSGSPQDSSVAQLDAARRALESLVSTGLQCVRTHVRENAEEVQDVFQRALLRGQTAVERDAPAPLLVPKASRPLPGSKRTLSESMDDLVEQPEPQHKIRRHDGPVK